MMKTSKPKISRRAYWQGQVRRLNDSGVSVASYCRKAGVKAERLYKWRRKLATSRPAGKSFVELQPSALRPRFGERYEIYLSPTPHIRVESGFNPETLKQVIAVLRGF